MTKNPIKFIRNPNSPEAIQARRDGYQDPTEYVKVHLITDPNAPYIFIDLTQEQVDQSVNYPINGGSKVMNKKLVTTALSLDSTGQAIITNYYTDVHNQQWVIIKSFLGKSLPTPLNLPAGSAFPRSTYSNTFGGFYSSAPGETWINQGKSVDKLREAQRRIFNPVKIEPEISLDKEQPGDRYEDDFTGQ